MGHAPYGHSNKGQQKKGPWTPEEDFLLTKYIETHGEGQWRTLPKKAGLQRCGKGCRLRWMNYLRPNVKRGNISTEEEELIIRLHRLLGNRWSLIAGRVPGRTDNEIKNYWNTRLSKKIRANAIARTTTADYKSKSSYVSHPDLKQSIFHQAMAYAERRNQIDKSVPATDNTSIIRQVFDGSSNNANVHGGDWDNDNPRSENYLYNSTDPLDQLNQACGIGAVKQDSPWHHADNQMIPSCSYEQQYINATNPFSDYLASYQMPTTSMHQLKDPNSVYLSGIENIYYYDNDLSSGAIFSDEAHFLSTVSADCIDGFTFDAELHNCDRKEAQKLNASEQYHSLDAEFHGSCFTHFLVSVYAIPYLTVGVFVFGSLVVHRLMKSCVCNL